MPARVERPGTPFGPDWQLRSLILRNQYGNQVIAEVEALLRAFYTELRDRLESGVDLTPAQTAQLESLTTWASSRLREVMSRVRGETTRAVLALGPVEAKALQAQAELLRDAMGLPSRAQLIQTARIQPLADALDKADIGGINFRDWWQRDAANALARIKRTVQSELLQGKGPREIARLAIARDPNVLTLERVSKASVRMIVRTAMTRVSSAASVLEYKEMADVIRVMRWESVIDSRTSDICAALDHREFRVDDPHAPHPPAHPACRSSLVPVIQASVLGLADADLGKRVTYDAWLRAQSAQAQTEILGKGRAALYQSGKISLADLIRGDGSRITLAELTRKLGAE